MRALRPAEARVTQSMLAGGAADAITGRLPRRTRQTVLRRLEGWGWFVERWVPAAACASAPILTIAIARPYAERISGAEAAWARDRATLFAWSADGFVVGAVASPSREDAAEAVRRLAPPADGGTELALSLDLRTDPPPAYFDFEGAWVRIGRLEAACAYPQGFDSPRRVPPDPAAERAPSDRVRRAVRALVESEEPAAGDQRALRAAGPTLETGEGDRLVRAGWLHRRRFLDPVAVARSLTTFPTQVVLVWGRPQTGVELRGLFPALVSEARVAPFLFHSSRDGVLAGFLGRSATNVIPDRLGVLPALQRYLTQIQSVRLPLNLLRTLVQHRFGPLVR